MRRMCLLWWRESPSVWTLPTRILATKQFALLGGPDVLVQLLNDTQT